jgi:hypothetical protein
VAPYPPLSFQHLKRSPQGASTDADLRCQHALGRKPSLLSERAVIQESPQSPEGDIRAVRKQIGVGHGTQLYANQSYSLGCYGEAFLRRVVSQRNKANPILNQFATGSAMVH